MGPQCAAQYCRSVDGEALRSRSGGLISCESLKDDRRKTRPQSGLAPPKDDSLGTALCSRTLLLLRRRRMKSWDWHLRSLWLLGLLRSCALAHSPTRPPLALPIQSHPVSIHGPLRPSIPLFESRDQWLPLSRPQRPSLVLARPAHWPMARPLLVHSSLPERVGLSRPSQNTAALTNKKDSGLHPNQPAPLLPPPQLTAA